MFEKKIMNGTIEYKMPKEMAAIYLIKVVNEEFGVKGTCVNVITF